MTTLAACETMEVPDECGFQPGMLVVVPGYCTDAKSAVAIADASTDSMDAAGEILRRAVMAGDCLYSTQPVAGLTVRRIARTYRDAKGRLTQILVATSPGAPETELHAIVLAAKARRPGGAQCHP